MLTPLLLSLTPSLPLPATELPAGFEHVGRASVQRLEPRETASGRRQVALEWPPASGRVRVLDLGPSDLRGANFRLRVQGADGALRDVDAPASDTWRGALVGEPGWSVAASFASGGLSAMALGPDGAAFFVQPQGQGDPGQGDPGQGDPGAGDPGAREASLVYELASSPVAGGCGVSQLEGPFGASALRPAAGAPCAERAGGAGGSCLFVADIAFDADFEFYQDHGSSVPASLAALEAVLNAVREMYAREVSIDYRLGDVIVRTAEPDPYPSNDPGEILNAFRNWWTANQAGSVRDMAHLATGKEMDTNVIGLAYVGVTCSQTFGYGLTQFTFSFGSHVSILAHELGHNWNAPHCLDPACVIMCGGCLEFGPVTTGVVLEHRDSRTCLDLGPGFMDSIPPKARADQFAVNGSTTLDVLANDYDGNCEAPLLAGFDSVSARGGTITSTGSELVYSAPAGLSGADTFVYQAGDAAGNTDDGPVTVHVYEGTPDLVAWFPMDDAGMPLDDVSGNDLDGNYFGDPTFGVAGAAPGTGLAVEFDGVDDRARFMNREPITWLRKNLTLTAWIRPGETSGDRTLFGNPSSWRLVVRDGVRLVFVLPSVDSKMQLVPLASGAWTHVALTFDNDGAIVFYADGVRIGERQVDAGAQAPESGWYIGTFRNEGEFFSGGIDDVQVYDAALSDDQVRTLFENPGQVLDVCSARNECVASPHSAGLGARMGSSGSSGVSANDLVLEVSAAPPMRSGIFFYGSDAVTLPFGDGVRCVGGTVARLPAPLATDGQGAASRSLDLTAPPAGSGAARITPGSTWRFQFWFRDPGGPGGSGFNTSDALAVRFCP